MVTTQSPFMIGEESDIFRPNCNEINKYSSSAAIHLLREGLSHEFISQSKEKILHGKIGLFSLFLNEIDG